MTTGLNTSIIQNWVPPYMIYWVTEYWKNTEIYEKNRSIK